MQQNSPWKLLVIAAVLLLFVGIGVAHVIYPDWFIKRSGIRKDGEMLNVWNRVGFQIAGATFTGFAVYMLYALFRD